VTNFPSETREGRVEDFYLQIARGQIPGHRTIHKFGAVPAMSQNQTGTVWDVDDTSYPWSSFSSAGVLNIDRDASESASTVVTIQGLDSNYHEISEDVTLTDTANNTTSNSFIRFNRAFVSSGTGTNSYDIVIQKDVTTVGTIKANNGQTLMAVYTIPANHTGYLTRGDSSVQSGADATVNFYVRPNGGSFRVQHSCEVVGTGGQYHYPFSPPFKLLEKSDLDVKASVRSNNARCTAVFDIILVKNG